MRISDWSSDVCSSDLHSTRQRAFSLLLARALRGAGFNYFGAETFAPKLADSMRDGAPDLATGIYTVEPLYADLARQAAAMGFRSEEHTSELQSLMRNSYAVFCLKKKKQHTRLM